MYAETNIFLKGKGQLAFQPERAGTRRWRLSGKQIQPSIMSCNCPSCFFSPSFPFRLLLLAFSSCLSATCFNDINWYFISFYDVITRRWNSSCLLFGRFPFSHAFVGNDFNEQKFEFSIRRCRSGPAIVWGPVSRFSVTRWRICFPRTRPATFLQQCWVSLSWHRVDWKAAGILHLRTTSKFESNNSISYLENWNWRCRRRKSITRRYIWRPTSAGHQQANVDSKSIGSPLR